jgi:hypothetical protein
VEKQPAECHLHIARKLLAMAVANATASSGLLNLERELQCFICTELLFQPLTLIDCLHTFCGACLKEWFGHQHKKASSSRSSSTSNPYTCPTCRATVKDARHNATVTTLLDMFLTANPTRGRTKEEEAEQLQIYKPGDEILRKVEPRRRREGRSRREEEDAEAEDRRLIEETRQRSLRDLENLESRSRLNVTGAGAPRSRSRGHEERRTRRREQERTERRRRVEEAERASARERGSEAAGIAETLPVPPPQSSPRHPEAVEARRRDSTIAHQPSLISLMSASESSTGTGDSLNEARIMQEILAEGLLEGINVDELTEQEQDELSERIAEAYRQRHQRTGQTSPPQTTDISNGHLPSRSSGAREDPAEDGARRQRRSHSHQPSSTGSSRSREVSTDAGRPPASRPHLLDVAESPGSGTHRRRASDQSRRQTSPLRPPRPNPTESSGTPATRSATDLSDTPSSDRGTSRNKPRQLSDNRRTNTEPQTATRVSDLWRQGGRESSPTKTAESTATSLPVRPLAREATDPSPPKDVTTFQQRTATVDSIPHTAERPQIASATTSPQSQKSLLQVLTRFQEPSISCARCSRQEIQYDLYKHCPTCKMDLCLRCYRTSRGCDHWFGFGKKAQANFLALQSAGPASQLMDPPHVFVGRKYLEAPPGTIQEPGVPLRSTTSNPAERLQEGHFCDRCHVIANACFWSCDYCNEGEWGFCNDCVNTHKCCVHPLLPLAHRSFAPKSPSSQDQPGYDPHISNIAMTPADLHAAIVTTPSQSRPSTAGSGANSSHHDEHPDYVTLSFKTDCDICSNAINPANPRYHCPSHPSPTPQNPTRAGDYDVCMPCYHQLVDTGKIKRDDGPAGWRKCPAGHRMIVVAFEEDTYMHQRRIVQADLVGGHLLDPNEMIGPRSRTGSMNASGSRFPPVGGSGKTYAAMWSYYPEEGKEGNGELMFPKWAEMRECEDQNEDWAFGVYMGMRGLVPRAFVREWKG